MRQVDTEGGVFSRRPLRESTPASGLRSRLARGIGDLLRRLATDTSGGFATTAALCTPVLAVLLAGAIDLAAVNATRAQLQAASDAAAIDAARQMTLTGEAGLGERAQANVTAQLTDGAGFSYDVAALAEPTTGRVTVTIEANRPSFFANLLPPGGWDITVTATAISMGQTPLCILATGDGGSDLVEVKDQARLTAPACMVHGNNDIRVDGAALLQAGVTQSSGLATGPISPGPQTGAPAITDPFASLSIVADSPCTPVTTILAEGVHTLMPGVHCGDLVVGRGSTLLLAPGEHYFMRGKLELKEDAILRGDDVVLIFDRDSKFEIKDNADVRLRGRRSGRYAGFVIATTRENRHTFEISSDSARELLGTIYIPRAILLVDGSNRVADQSAWTVLVAQSIQLKNRANLVVNANYASSTVPVPTGVGPTAAEAQVRLAQ